MRVIDVRDFLRAGSEQCEGAASGRRRLEPETQERRRRVRCRRRTERSVDSELRLIRLTSRCPNRRRTSGAGELHLSSPASGVFFALLLKRNLPLLASLTDERRLRFLLWLSSSATSL